MKSRSNRFFPQTLVVCIAPLLACASAQAAILNFNEASTTNVWTFQPGVNLLASATVTGSEPLVDHGEGTSTNWAPLTNGNVGDANGADTGNSVAPANNTSVIYALDVSVGSGHSVTGYNITSFDAYGAWANTGRDNLNFTIEYSTMANPAGFVPLATINNQTPFPGSPLRATHTNLTETSGILASGVHSIRLNFSGQENNWVGYREFILRADTPLVFTELQSNKTNAWTLPAGTNLLNGTTAVPSTLPINENSSPSWSTVTNGILGTPGNNSASVTPLNNTSVVFPLNTAVNVNGYNLSSIDTYAAWINTGRDNQDLSISYSKVGAESVFLPLANPYIRTGPELGSDNATHIRLFTDSGFLATGVSSIKFSFPNQENGYVGYREFIALGSAVSISDPLTWTGGSGSTWIAGADSNWKQTVGGAPAVYNAGAGLTFDSVPSNRNITVSAPLTAFSMEFTNDDTHPYTFGNSLLTVSNAIVSSGTGSATFNNPVKASTGVSVSESGSLVFNGALESTSLALSGGGGITLNAANPALTGSAVVSDGTLTVSHNNGLQSAGLSMTGGTALFSSSAPVVASISSLSTVPEIVLGNPGGPTNLSVGDAASVTGFAGKISQASGTTGSLTKTGASSLSLSGVNTYTGTTTVSGGVLQLTRRQSLYDGTTASWTAGNITVASGATLGFDFGTFDEFTADDLNTGLSLGGFASGSFLGINTAFENLTLSRNLTQPGLGLVKTGSAILNLTGTNTSNGPTRIFLGALNAASAGGTSLGGNVQIGNASGLVYLNMNLGVGNQFAPGSGVTFANGNFYNATMNLRGTNQAIAGLDAAPFPANKISIVQNDEIGHPGYTVAPGPASLTINATTDHSFAGLIRDQNGGPVSLIKNGTGTQELVNLSDVTSYNYTGQTTVENGTLRLNFAGNNKGFASNVLIQPSGTLHFRGVEINGAGYSFTPLISGVGKVVVDGLNAVRLENNTNSWSGGTTVGRADTIYYGYLALVGNGSAGQGTAPGQYCAGGAMTPSNLINVLNGATLALDGVAPLGHSTMLPEFGLSIRITANSTLSGGGGLAFVPNITLDGGKIEITNGRTDGGFNSNLAFVGTLVVGGSSTVPAEIKTIGTGPNANASLGSSALPGTIFQVADVSAVSADTDLTVSSILRNVGNSVSPLTKTGPGTMLLSGENTYTGATTVSDGTLIVSGNSIANSNKLAIDGTGVLGVETGANETVRTLFIDGIQQIAGTYGSLTSGAEHPSTRFSGTGIVTVTKGPGVTYEAWSLVIPNPSDRDRTDDPDGDGFSNLNEFLFGTSPIASNGTLSTVETTGSTLIVRWCERVDSASVYLLQESTTLQSPWPTSAVIPTTDNNQDALYSTEYVRKQAVIPVNSVKKFVRVQATE